MTNEEGKANVAGRTWLQAAAVVEEEGYYWSSVDVPKNDDLEAATFAKREAELVLREKKGPVALYRRAAEIVPPVFGEPFGYDLEVGDYAAPHGEGKRSDLVFTTKLRQGKDEWDFDYSLTVSFSNAEDGLIVLEQIDGCEFTTPFYDAPEGGYVGEWVYTRSARPGEPEKKNSKANRCYALRLRTVVDEDGEIVSSNYAKIHGDFPKFRYFYNPRANDRNLEHDPEQNLADPKPKRR